MDEPSPTKDNKTSKSTFSTPRASNRNRRNTIEAFSAMQCSTPQSTPSKRLGYVPVEIARTTPKPSKGAKRTPLAIMDTPQEMKLLVTGKDIQKSVHEKCPTVDTNRLRKRRISIDGPNESVIAECPPESPPAEKNGDLFSRLASAKKPIVVKRIDTSF